MLDSRVQDRAGYARANCFGELCKDIPTAVSLVAVFPPGEDYASVNDKPLTRYEEKDPAVYAHSSLLPHTLESVSTGRL